MSKELNNLLIELKEFDGECLTTILIVNIKLLNMGLNVEIKKNEQYFLNNSEPSSKLVMAGTNPGVGWYRCIKCNNQVFILRDRDMLHNCTECNGYGFRLI